LAYIGYILNMYLRRSLAIGVQSLGHENGDSERAF
jgi:hypothetical protein